MHLQTGELWYTAPAQREHFLWDETNSAEDTGESREALCFLNLPCTLRVTDISPSNTTLLCCCQNTELSVRIPPSPRLWRKLLVRSGEGFWMIPSPSTWALTLVLPLKLSLFVRPFSLDLFQLQAQNCHYASQLFSFPPTLSACGYFAFSSDFNSKNAFNV